MRIKFIKNKPYDNNNYIYLLSKQIFFSPPVIFQHISVALRTCTDATRSIHMRELMLILRSHMRVL